MRHAEVRHYSDAATAARKLVELAVSIETVQDGRIHIETINYPFLFTLKGNGSEFGAGIRHAVEKGWIELHESGTFLRLLTPGDDLLGQ
jgi:hypothetical protein